MMAAHMIEGIQTRVFGPKAAETEAAGFLLRPETVRQVVALFSENLSKRNSGPVQMLVEAPDMPASVVNLFRYYGKAAVAHVLRVAPTGNVPALAGVFVLLPGLDPDADEAAVAAVEASRDKTGAPLPFPPKVYAMLRADVRPLLAMLFYTPEAVTDTSLRMLGVCLAEAYFASVRRSSAK
jgi:hypothetical protein